MRDQLIADLITRETHRQVEGIELIASENYASDQVMEAQGSVLTNKYAEGLPRRRYYGGCEVVDEVEQLAIDRLCQLFGAKWANVQPHSGASANAAVMLAVLNPGDPILGFDLSHGGSLTHCSTVNYSGNWFFEKNSNLCRICAAWLKVLDERLVVFYIHFIVNKFPKRFQKSFSVEELTTF